jgi:hypothetical protein
MPTEERTRLIARSARGFDLNFRYPSNRTAGAAALEKNIPRFVQKLGISKIGMLMLTFPTKISTADASTCWNNALRRELRGLFGHWIRVVEFTKGGRLHMHALVECAADIRTGFDFDAYRNYVEAIRTTTLSLAQRRGLRNGIGANPILRGLWEQLEACLPEFGFGVFDLFPIEKDESCVARYLSKQFRSGLPYQARREKGARLISYSRGCPRAVPPGWRPPNPAYCQRMQRLFEVFGIKDKTEARDLLGSKWNFSMLKVAECLDSQMTPFWHEKPVGEIAFRVLRLSLHDPVIEHYVGDHRERLSATIAAASRPLVSPRLPLPTPL